MKKNLIIGGFTGYRFNQIKPWVTSIQEVAHSNVDLVMAVGDTDQDTKDRLTALGWQLEHLPSNNQIPVHVLRFLPMYNYLADKWQDYDLVVSTDVKDVIFQKDPFAWLSANLGDKKLVAGSEALKYCHEPWGDDNLKSTYGGYVYDRFKNNTIYNVGTLGGKSDYMRDLFFNLFYNSISRPIPVVDQAVFNVLIQTLPYRDVVLFADQKTGWACQAGTVADPAKMNYFKPNLLEGEPIWDNGQVLTSGQDPFVIVHQYDRVPEWRKFYDNKYR